MLEQKPSELAGKSRFAAGAKQHGFTLVELLVVVSIIALLIAIIMPSLRNARLQGKGTVCYGNLHVLGQGLTMYALDNNDAMLPCRMPKLSDNINWRVHIAGGLKYRPTFLAMMGSYVGVPAFEDPQPIKNSTDRYGEAGDRQDYSNDVYLCPAVAHWTDERNGAYGYNYHFLGNARLIDDNDPTSFKNWPVSLTTIRSPADCVAVGDSMGTAASFATRKEYVNNGRNADQLGNEGFNLDPPLVDATNGEMANFDKSPQSRTAVHTRHLGRGSILWLDGHCSRETLEALGYAKNEEGIVTFDGSNRFFTPDGRSYPWLQ